MSRGDPERVREAIQATRYDGKQRQERCPAHDDARPSLSIGMGSDGDRVVIHDHGGCHTEDVLAACGLGMRDLYVDRDIGPADEPTRRRPREARPRPTTTAPRRAPATVPRRDNDVLDWLRVPTGWAGDYADLSIVAWGIHTRLALVSARRGPLPADRAGLARLAGISTRELTRCWPALTALWDEADGYVRCRYVEDERARMTERTEQMRELGRRGAASRWGGTEPDEAVAHAMAPANGDRDSTRHALRHIDVHADVDPDPDPDPDVETDPVRCAVSRGKDDVEPGLVHAGAEDSDDPPF